MAPRVAHAVPDGSPRSPALRHPPVGSASLPARMFQGPVSLFLYGSSVPVVNLTLYALAEAVNPAFHWVDVRARNDPSDSLDPATLGWVSRGRLVTFDPPETMRPGAPVPVAAVSTMIAGDEPRESLQRLIAFLQLPDATQCFLAIKPQGARPGIVAVPNVHRAVAAFANARVEPIIDAHLHAGYSLFVGYSEVIDGHRRPVGPGRGAFDYVFHVSGDGLSSWTEGRLRCEKGGLEGPFRTGSEIRLVDLPFVAGVFHRAQAEPRSGMPRP